MSELLGKAQGLVALRAGLRMIPAHPQGPGIIAQTCRAKVHTGISIVQYIVLLRVIEGNRVLQMHTGQGGVAQIKPTGSERQMRLQE
jgi:hypothetical protein